MIEPPRIQIELAVSMALVSTGYFTMGNYRWLIGYARRHYV